jgi:hypothetical protein
VESLDLDQVQLWRIYDCRVDNATVNDLVRRRRDERMHGHGGLRRAFLRRIPTEDARLPSLAKISEVSIPRVMRVTRDAVTDDGDIRA